MASVTSLGVGSGVELGNLLDSLLTAEADATTNRLNAKEIKVQAKISAYGSLSSALSSFRSSVTTLNDSTKFQPRTATSSDDSKFTVSADSNSVPGAYDITVSSVAKAEQLKSATYETTALTDIGGGAMTIEIDGESFTITLDDSASSLNDIRDAVNNATDNVGVTATVINSNSGAKIVFSSNDVGTTNTMKITTDDNDGNDIDTNGLSKLVYDTGAAVTNLTEYVGATNAIITVNGETVTSTTSNAITTAIDGVTITAVANTTETEKLTVAHDKTTVFDNVKAFISAYNSLQATISALNQYDAENEAAGTLLGDPTLRNIDNRLARAIGSEISGLSSTYNSLSDVGVSFDKDGKLILNSEQLTKILDSNFNAVGNLFADKAGTLDQQHQLNSATFDETTTVVGQGTLAISVGGSSFNVAIGAGEETLAGIRDAINAEGTNTGVTASLRTVNGGTDYQLVLTSNTAGSASALSVTVTDNDGNNTNTSGLSQLVYDTANSVTNMSELTASTKAVSDGIANVLDELLEQFIGKGGSVSTSSKVLTDEVSRITTEREKLEVRLQRMQDRLTAKFTNLDILLTQLNSTSEFLTGQLEAIAQIGKSNK